MIVYDLLGACASLLSTYYFIRVDSKAWPIGLFSTCFNSWLYWKNGIYADMALQSFYFLSICYGWHRWSKQKHLGSTSIKRLSNKQLLSLCITILGLYALIFNLLMSFSHSTVAKLDALTTSLSLVAQLLMCYKIITTWILWLIADALYALMYWHKTLPFHTLLMLPYTGMAFIGFYQWHKKDRLEKMSNLPPLPSNHSPSVPTA